MKMMQEYEIRDLSLAPSGHQKIDWVEKNMPVLNKLREDFSKTKPFQGVKISLSVHLEAKTAYLCKVLAAAGANMSVTGSNSLSTQDDIAAALVDEGMRVFAYHDATDEEYSRHIGMALDFGPNIIIDDGGDLVHMVHTEKQELIPNIWGGCEETTTGVIRLKAMELSNILKFPMVAVNDANAKYLFDNRYGTGQSVWTSIMNNTNLIIAGKHVVVAGYGWCGKGIAMRGKALGANVIVTEIDPLKAVEAVMDGFDVMTMEDAALLGDFFITATGCKDVITTDHMLLMKDGAILCNAGHFNVEVDVAGLKTMAVDIKEMRKNIMGYKTSKGRWVHLIGDGKLVNIAASDGHPAEIMDMSFAVQFMGAMHILNNRGKLDNKVIDVADDVDNMVAEIKLNSLDVKIDKLTEEQKRYLNSWNLE